MTASQKESINYYQRALLTVNYITLSIPLIFTPFLFLDTLSRQVTTTI